MGRIRTVKPELFRHLALFEAEEKYQLPLRIAFVGLFTCCDRQGRFIWQPRRLKVDILPYDEADINDVLNALMESGFIKAYEVKGIIYGCIPTWVTHQYFNNKEAYSQLPDVTEGKILKAPITQSMLSVHARLSEEAFERTAHEQNPPSTNEDPIPYETITQGKTSRVITSSALVQPLELTLTATTSQEDILIAENPLLLDENSLEEKNESNIYINQKLKHVAHACITSDALIGKEGKGKERNTEEKIKNSKHCPAPPEAVSKIFDHWQTVMNHPQARLDKIRHRYIRDALAMGYGVFALCQAIDGCSLTPHNLGQNKQGQRYDGLHIIFKSADQIDRFIYNSKNPPRLFGKADERLQNNINAAQAWLHKTQS
jgi:hypothetical protein